MSKKRNVFADSDENVKKKSLLQHVVSVLFSLIFLAALAGVCFVGYKKVVTPVFDMYVEANRIVSASSPKTFQSELTSIVYDTNKQEIKKLKGEKNVYYLKFKKIPDAAKLAIISIEDKNYVRHKGVDVEGLARAVLYLVTTGSKGVGGSTITMQLSRNIFLNFEKTYSRKLMEIFISIALERKYSKEELLEFYLNNVYFANGNYGIEAAAQAYFNRSAAELSISQIAFLCAIPNSPTRYDPYQNPEGTLARRDKILKNMYKDKKISEEQYEASLDEQISLSPKKEISTNDYAETYIIHCATLSLMKQQKFDFQYTFANDSQKQEYKEKYNELYSSCRSSLYTGGYRIYTSVDMNLQKALQDSITNGLAMFQEKTDDGVYQVQGAAVCIDNSTGRVVAIVGGREENQEGYGLNRAYQSFRQPGSAIKPVLVYAPAFDRDYTPDSTVDDSYMSGPGAVSNADRSYQGHISITKAVQKSSNVATLRLYQTLGSRSCLNYLERMDFAGLADADYKYDTTCIGGFTNGTTAVEMAASYAALANDGNYRTPTCIVRITDAEGRDMVEKVQEKSKVYSSKAALYMTNVLKSCVTSPTATARNCKLEQSMPAACKTGTTSKNVDGWLCGYTPYYTTAVWVGRDVFKPVDNLKGNTYPAYIWKNYMDKLTGYCERDTILDEQFGEIY